jgi:hypothetical protein
MGVPSSIMLSEIFLHFVEWKRVMNLSSKQNILDYFCYIDNFLIMYDWDETDINILFTDFNQIHPKLQFTLKPEKNNIISYLDLYIQRQPSTFRFTIYRKPTFTDTIIPFTQCYPIEHTL